MRRTAFSLATQRFQRWMQDFVDQAMKRTLNLVAATFVEMLQSCQQARQFFLFEIIGPLFQTLNRRHGRPIVKLRHDPHRLLVDDRLGLGPLALAGLAVCLTGLL